uniref:Hypothetical secreted peptide n=1 Tax=Glossina morsitans morsitans TaxID=37546 RepID=D3TSP0_GLOMM
MLAHLSISWLLSSTSCNFFGKICLTCRIYPNTFLISTYVLMASNLFIHIFLICLNEWIRSIDD